MEMNRSYNNISPTDLKVPNNCDDDINELNSRRAGVKLEDIKVSIINQTEDYLIINKPVTLFYFNFIYLF